MSKENTILRFDNVSFKYDDKKVVLREANFGIKRNSKITIMGQNGAGKSTIFKLITGKLKPTGGQIHIDQYAKIGIAEQMIQKDKLDLSVLEYFEAIFDEKIYGIEKEIYRVLETVNLEIALDKKVKELSGGQKARLLLASALIQNPDILLLDEPTNNLDDEGIKHLTEFLIYYPKTCLVISHDAEFLNSFTEGVLNLDVHTQKIEQFVGDYFDVIEQIGMKLERDRLQNARIKKSVQDRFEKVNKLGGKSVAMRRLARKVREDIERDREDIVDVRKEDKTIIDFIIPNQNYPYPLIKIDTIEILKAGNVKQIKIDKELRRGHRMLISGPNGIGKSTLLKALLDKRGATIDSEVKVGYYSQDFSELDFEQTGMESLRSVMTEHDMQKLFKTAAQFLLNAELLQNKIGSYSEGQKGLLCYARFVLQEPGLLIMDEPTNHINFRHLPVIAEALNNYAGAMILVTHDYDFLDQVEIDEELDLRKY